MLRMSVGLLSCLVAHSAAISLPFKAQPRTLPHADVTSKDASNPFNFSNVNDFSGGDIYVASLTAGGTTFQVQLDTGSSDLWLDTTNLKPSGTQDTGVVTGIKYGDGTIAQGSVLIANVTFGNFSVPQAFISAPGTNATANGDTGLLGVGPPSLSAITTSLQATAFNGTTLLGNIFADNPTENVTGNSQLNVTGQGPTQTLANLDTGTSFAAIPRFYADAIYSAVPGAQFDPSLGGYNLPCDTKIDLSFVFGGVVYPVHPIDTVQAMPGGKGTVTCFSGFLVTPGEDPTEDFLLGDSFLRNVYSFYDFGSFISGPTSPYIQLLSTTDASAADSEFATLSAQRNASITGKVPSSGGGGGGGSAGGNGAPRTMLSSTIILSAIGLGLSVTFI